MLKQLKWSALVSSLVYIAVGVLMFLYPSSSADMVSIAAGAGLCAYGVIELVVYFMMDVKDTLYRNEFVFGIMSLLIGALLFVKRDILMMLVPLILGAAVLLSGFMKLQKGVVSARIGYSRSLFYFVISSVSVVAGIAIMFFMTGRTTQEVLFKVIGGSLVYSGLSDIFTTLYLAGKFNQYVTFYEENLKKQEEPEVPVQPEGTDTPAEEVPAEEENAVHFEEVVEESVKE